MTRTTVAAGGWRAAARHRRAAPSGRAAVPHRRAAPCGRAAVPHRRAAPCARALAVLLAAALALPAAAPAHAVLQHTAPHANGSVPRPPAEVRLDFDEPVEAAPGAVRVYDVRGTRVDVGRATVPAGRPRSVAVGLRDGLGRGTYTATYRVVSADGHPVSGGFAWAVGSAPAPLRERPQVADLLARSSAGPALEGTYGAVRGLHYLALLVLVGAVAFRGLAWPARSPRPWPARLLVAACAAGAACALAGVALQGALAAGVPLGRALDPEILRGSLSTRTGEAWLLRACAWVLALVIAALFPHATRRRDVLGLALPAAVLCGSLPWAGHADTQEPRALLIPADLVHVLAAGTWLGGLIVLVACFWPRGARAPLDGAVEATARFSRVALPAVAALTAAGVAQAWFHLGSVGALVHGLYGWALLAKVALLGGVVALAAGNRRRTARLVAGGAAAPVGGLRRAMGAEVGLAVLVLAATAALVRAAPPATAASGPVVRELDLGPMRVTLDLEPARAGRNDLHLYLFDRRTGAQVSRVEQLTVRLAQPGRGIGPIALDIPRAGPAHYERLGALLGVRGRWDVEVTARLSAWDEVRARTEVELRD